LFPEDLKTARKLPAELSSGKANSIRRKPFGQSPLPVNDSCKHAAGNSAANSTGNSAAKLFRQENPQESELFCRKIRRKAPGTHVEYFVYFLVMNSKSHYKYQI
jgi:hypothetical protein